MVAAVGGKSNEIFDVVHLFAVVVPFVFEVPGGFLWGVGFVFAEELEVVAVFEAVEQEVDELPVLRGGVVGARVMGVVAARTRMRIGRVMRRFTGNSFVVLRMQALAPWHSV